jgi:hypothetical protein
VSANPYVARPENCVPHRDRCPHRDIIPRYSGAELPDRTPEMDTESSQLCCGSCSLTKPTSTCATSCDRILLNRLLGCRLDQRGGLTFLDISVRA